MLIKEIELRDFRNYESLNLQFHNRVNIFIGNNAQGKTNILESIYVSSVGKSFRTTHDSEMIKFGRDFSMIKVLAEKDEDPLFVEIAIIKDGKKGIKVDGVKIKKRSQLLEHIYCVVFSPEDLKIVKEQPEKRRTFIDKTLSQLKPSYYAAIYQYKKILQQRNALLKEIKGRGKTHDMLLAVWDEKLAFYGAEIMTKRAEFIKKLAVISESLHFSITGEREKTEITYEPDVNLGESVEEQKNIILNALSDSEKKDIYSGATRRGPHKDDICIKIEGADIRSFGSQGQQRTAALSLKLGELRLIKEETKEVPILLLDDVMSELDAVRQSFLVNSLAGVQLFITTTELAEDMAKNLPPGKVFQVNSGSIKE